jgi:hypothetical protein
MVEILDTWHSQSTELTPLPTQVDWSVSPKGEMWFLRVRHRISNAAYYPVLE